MNNRHMDRLVDMAAVEALWVTKLMMILYKHDCPAGDDEASNQNSSAEHDDAFFVYWDPSDIKCPPHRFQI